MRLLLADDNPAMLEMLIDMLDNRFVITGTATCGASVLSQVAAANPDIVLLDISLGDLTGFDVARRLRKSGCRAKIVFLSVHENCDFVRTGLDLGGSAYVFKSRISVDLLPALQAVSDGDQFISTSSMVPD